MDVPEEETSSRRDLQGGFIPKVVSRTEIAHGNDDDEHIKTAACR